MTEFIRDMSHYDGDESLSGFVGTTHKVTEGTSYVDSNYAVRLNRYHAQGVPVLGSYHVVHTGNLGAQLEHWLSTMDALTPWWRDHPHFILQIDAEKWPDDPDMPGNVKAFAQLLVNSDAPGWKVTYASRGQYGDSLTGIATPLWNAHYVGTYPGDGSADWAPYSGKVPTLLQYTSTPFDKNAFRGSLDELLAMIGGDMDFGPTDPNAWHLATRVDALVHGKTKTALGEDISPFYAAVAQAVAPAVVAALPAAGAPTDAQVNAAVAAVMNDPAWLDALAARFGTALAAHVHVS